MTTDDLIERLELFSAPLMREAAAALRAAQARERVLREAAQGYLDAESAPAFSLVIESQEARAEGRPNREAERVDRINAARRALRTALAAAEPKQEDDR